MSRQRLLPLLLTAVLLPAVHLGRCAERQMGSLSFGNWTPTIGDWSSRDGIYTQSTTQADCRTFAPLTQWADYVYEVKARKLSGHEGFLILFRVQDHEHFCWWNIAGWGNTRHALETRPRSIMDPRPGTVEENRWYDIQLVVKGNSIRCYLDGELIHDCEDGRYPAGGIGLGSWRTEVEYKDVRVTFPDGTVLSPDGVTPPAPSGETTSSRSGRASSAARRVSSRFFAYWTNRPSIGGTSPDGATRSTRSRRGPSRWCTTRSMAA